MSVCFDHELLDPRGPSWNGGWERWRRKDISVTYDAFIKKLVYCWTPCIFCVWDQSGAERIPSCQLKKKRNHTLKRKPYPAAERGDHELSSVLSNVDDEHCEMWYLFSSGPFPSSFTEAGQYHFIILAVVALVQRGIRTKHHDWLVSRPSTFGTKLTYLSKRIVNTWIQYTY